MRFTQTKKMSIEEIKTELQQIENSISSLTESQLNQKENKSTWKRFTTLNNILAVYQMNGKRLDIKEA
jgi:hypothetical protein